MKFKFNTEWVPQSGMAPALALQQPWPWPILYAGKRIENRTWRTRYQGELVLLASKKIDPEFDWSLFTRMGCEVPSDFPTGGIVGMCKLAYVVKNSVDPWFVGPYGFILRNVRPVEFVSYPGSLGLFGVPSELVREVVTDGHRTHFRACQRDAPLRERACTHVAG